MTLADDNTENKLKDRKRDYKTFELDQINI